MELTMENGGYVSGKNGRLKTVSGEEEKAQRIMMRLIAHRGAFPLMPEFGSRLYTLTGTKNSEIRQLAVQYISEALESESGVSISDIEAQRSGDELTLEISLSVDGDHVTVKTVI